MMRLIINTMKRLKLEWKDVFEPLIQDDKTMSV